MKKKIYLLSIALSLLVGLSSQVMACLCSTAPAGDVAQAYATYSGGVLSDPFPTANKTGTIAYSGQTIYYLTDGICQVGGCASGGPFWTVSGGTIVVSEFLYTGLYAIGIQWGAAGTGSLTPTNYTGFGVPALSVTINGCSQGNISGAYTSYNTGTNTLSGFLTYPAAVNAGDIVYYKASSKTFYGTFAFVVTNGILLNTYTASDGYKVAEVQWGTAGAASIVATAGGFCPTPQSITVTTPGLVFDGTDDRVTIAHASAYNLGTGNFTIEGWIKASSSQNSNATIFSNRSSTSDGIWFGLDTDGTLMFIINGTTINGSDTDLRDDTWHHVAMTRTGTRTFDILVDGVDDGGGRPPAAATITTSHDVWIGDDDGDPSNNSFTGTIKGIRFWSVGKTDVELLAAWKTNLNQYSTALIGCWDMNDINTQTQTDQSATGNNGELGSTSGSDAQDPVITPNSPAPFTINALLFDGNTQRATITDMSSYNMGTADFTIEAWIFPVNDAQTKTIISRRTSSSSNGFALYVDGTGKPVFKITGTSLTGSTSVNDGQWHHVAVIRSTGTLSIYVDASTACGTTPVTSESLSPSGTCDLWIGQDKGSEFSGFNGQIDEVRIWNVARASSDIFGAQNHAQIISDLTQTSNLKGWWRFNAAVAQLDEDLSSVGNNSTLGLTNAVEVEDPLRTAGTAFAGSRIGSFSNINTISNSSVSFLAIKSYPNPFTGNISLNVTGLSNDNAEITVLDITGIEVYKTTTSENTPIIFGEKLLTGIYIVKVTDESTVKTIRIVKNK